MEDVKTKEQSSKDQYAEFNRFQTMFYTSIEGFGTFTDYEIRKHAFMLISNMGKGLPYLADEILNIYSPDVKAIQSPAIIRALQRRFVNGFSYARMPQFLYQKSTTPKKEPKGRGKKVAAAVETVKGLEFDPKVVSQIQSRLMLDSKSFEALKYTERVQNLGKMLTEEFNKSLIQEIKTPKRK